MPAEEKQELQIAELREANSLIFQECVTQKHWKRNKSLQLVCSAIAVPVSDTKTFFLKILLKEK